MKRNLRMLFVVVAVVSFFYCYGMNELRLEAVNFEPKNGFKNELGQEEQSLLPKKKPNLLIDTNRHKKGTCGEIRGQFCKYYKEGKFWKVKKAIASIKRRNEQEEKNRENSSRFLDNCLEDACWSLEIKNHDELVKFFVDEGVRLNKSRDLDLYLIGCSSSLVHSPFLLTAVATGNLSMVQALVKHGAVIDQDTMFHLGMAIKLRTLVGCCLGCFGYKKDLCKDLREVKKYLVTQQGLQEYIRQKELYDEI